MSQIASRPLTCQRCGGTITPGTRIDRTDVGNWASCLRRGAVRHYSADACTATPAAAFTPAARRGERTTGPSLGYDRSALGSGEGFYGDHGYTGARAVRQDVYGGEE